MAILAGVADARGAPPPFAYRFAPIPGVEDTPRPHPEIDARFSSAYRGCLADPRATTYKLDMCDEAEMAVQDAALNRQWRQTLARLAPARGAALRAAERAWIARRAAFCGENADRYAGGTIMPLVYGSCYVNETIRRTLWLAALRS